jgi:hypothetical protein
LVRRIEGADCHPRSQQVIVRVLVSVGKNHTNSISNILCVWKWGMPISNIQQWLGEWW